MRLRYAWAALLVGVTALAAAGHPAAASPAPGGAVRIDTSDPEAVVLSGARTAGRRGVMLSFVGAAPVSDRKGPCRLGYAATSDEGRYTVTVAVRPVYRAVHRAGGARGCDDLGVGRLVTVRLDRPLGARTLVDAATGDPVPVFDGRARLRPSWLPEGWARRGEGGGGCWSTTPVPCWNQTWGTAESDDPDSCEPGSGYVELAQAVGPAGPGAIVADDAVTATPATVRGVLAEVLVDTRGLGSVIVRWREGDQSLVLYGASACAGAAAPAPELVTRIADHLH